MGIRRLRTALRELGDLTDAIDPAWEGVLVSAFRDLGAHRDNSHLALVLQSQWQLAGGPDLKFDKPGGHILDAGETVRAPSFQDALLGLLGNAYRPVPQPLEEPGTLKKAITRRLGKLHTRALRDGKKFLALDEEQQHGVRKRLKRLRYLMEFAAPLFAARSVGKMAAALKPAQDALGLYNDELVALQALHKLVDDQPNAWFGIGWLTARRERNAKRCLKEIKVFAKIKPFWRE